MLWPAPPTREVAEMHYGELAGTKPGRVAIAEKGKAPG